jgi:hypothetical protein
MVSTSENAFYIITIVLVLTLCVWLIWLCKPRMRRSNNRHRRGDVEEIELRNRGRGEGRDDGQEVRVATPPPAVVDWWDLRRDGRGH